MSKEFSEQSILSIDVGRVRVGVALKEKDEPTRVLPALNRAQNEALTKLCEMFSEKAEKRKNT